MIIQSNKNLNLFYFRNNLKKLNIKQHMIVNKMKIRNQKRRIGEFNKLKRKRNIMRRKRGICYRRIKFTKSKQAKNLKRNLRILKIIKNKRNQI